LSTQNVTNEDANPTHGPLAGYAFAACRYDALKHMVGTGSADGLVSCPSNPLGKGILLSNAAGVIESIVHPNAALSQVLMRVRPGVTNYYVYGFGLLYEVTETATNSYLRYYHYDYRGSTVALTDGSGKVTDRFEYSVYGTLTYRFGSTDTPFLYNGRFGVQTDPNGLLYMRARYYNPYICRFINPDPVGFAGGLNWYMFADGNPVNYLDPYGLAYGNPVCGPNGQMYPSDPFAPGGAFYVPSPWKPDIMTSFVSGAAVGAVIAGAVTVAAPAAVSVLTGAGFSATAAQATVTAGLYIGGGYGAYQTVVSTAQNAGVATVTGDWSPVAFDIGTVVGGGAVGVSGGGRALAEGIMGRPSPAPATWNLRTILDYEIANRYRFDMGPPGIQYWATAPTPFSGGFAATAMASGVGTLIEPFDGAQTPSNRSWINPWGGLSLPNEK